MNNRKRLGSSLGDVTVTEIESMVVIKQKRPTKDGGRYIVTLTLDEARAVADNLRKRIELHDELQRRDLT